MITLTFTCATPDPYIRDKDENAPVAEGQGGVLLPLMSSLYDDNGLLRHFGENFKLVTEGIALYTGGNSEGTPSTQSTKHRRSVWENRGTLVIQRASEACTSEECGWKGERTNTGHFTVALTNSDASLLEPLPLLVNYKNIIYQGEDLKVREGWTL